MSSNIIQFKKYDDNAIIPSRVSEHDVGFDITLISLKHTFFEKNIFIYDTGLVVKPPPGCYIEVVQTSSTFGYVLLTSFGTYNTNYNSTIKLVLTKIDLTCPNISLPYKGFKLVVKKAILPEPVEVESVQSFHN